MSHPLPRLAENHEPTMEHVVLVYTVTKGGEQVAP
jgi:hypothetical protein